MAGEIKIGNVRTKGQITIPQDLREKYGLEEGAHIAFEETPSGILIKPMVYISQYALDQLGRALPNGTVLQPIAQSDHHQFQEGKMGQPLTGSEVLAFLKSAEEV